MAKKKEGSVNRSIYYYDVCVENIEENMMVEVADTPQILCNAFKRIKDINDKLLSEGKKERRQLLRKIEYTTENSDKIYIDVDSIDEISGRIKFRIILCRSDALPYVEQDGKLVNLTKFVDGNFNLAEVTHCILFIKEKIMGAEFNFNGARPSTICAYLPTITKQMDCITCAGKIRKDVFDRIVEDEGFSLFRICVKNTGKMRQILRENMGFIGNFFTTTENIDTYEISIKRRVTKKKEGFIPPMSIEELGKFVEQNREDINSFQISQGTYKDAIDLLSDKLVSKRDFILTENKTIDSDEMYASINNYFDGVVKNI